MVSIKRSQFAGLNDISYYFSDGICSFTLQTFSIKQYKKCKKKKYKHIHWQVQQIKYCLLHDENKLANKCERTSILRLILNQPFTYFKFDSKKRLASVKSPMHSTKYYVLNRYWM